MRPSQGLNTRSLDLREAAADCASGPGGWGSVGKVGYRTVPLPYHLKKYLLIVTR